MEGGHSEGNSDSPPSAGEARRERFPLEAVATIGAILLGLWLGAKHVQGPADLVRFWFTTAREQEANAIAHYNLGRNLQHRGKLQAAIKSYRDAIGIKPAFAEAHYYLAKALKDQGKLAEAIAEFRKARDLAQPGSELARRIEHALTESGGEAGPRDR
jgi:tetratricopeptide (TPR) repeat protein